MAELADAQDLKSCGTYLSYRFDSGLRHHINIAGWSSWQLVGLITRRSQVRVLPPQPNKYGPLVKRSRHRPFTAVTGVRFPYGSPIPGTIAQLGEHLPYKQGVTGSSPVSPTIRGLVVQLVRMPACHAGGRGFESLPGRQFNILCWCGSTVEQLTCNQQVVGSIPITSSNVEDFPSGQRGQTVNLLALLSVVRIHHPPPEKIICGCGGIGRRTRLRI